MSEIVALRLAVIVEARVPDAQTLPMPPMEPRIFPTASADAALEDHENQAREPDDDLKPARKLVRHSRCFAQ
jgi:hypothetical protein